MKCVKEGCDTEAKWSLHIKIGTTKTQTMVTVCDEHKSDDLATKKEEMWPQIEAKMIEADIEPTKSEFDLSYEPFSDPTAHWPRELLMSFKRISTALQTFDQVNTQSTKIQSARSVIQAAQSAQRTYRNYPGAAGRDERKVVDQCMDALAKCAEQVITMVSIHDSESEESVGSTKAAINALAEASKQAGLAFQAAMNASAGN